LEECVVCNHEVVGSNPVTLILQWHFLALLARKFSLTKGFFGITAAEELGLKHGAIDMTHAMRHGNYVFWHYSVLCSRHCHRQNN
jgi:hypothetical protein